MVRTLLLIALVSLASCTWVKPKPGSEQIRVIPADQGAERVADCERLGTTRASVRDRVAGVQRKPGKVAEEIETLARTSAMEMGADTLVELGPVQGGAREFAVYRCKPPQY